ncbi:MAG: hypothetical protein DRP68_07385 [Candidatus Omnitrophota bacterium]|nr:MAG: hypothetical protein DRP68_07385 [Candidatus Omnitrophota bacterium]
MTFSVGRIQVGETTIAKCTGITVRYEGNPVEFYGGGYKEPLEIELGNMSITITVEFAEWSEGIDPDSVLPNTYVDVQLLASSADANRGIDGLTLSRCKAVSWETASTQDGFVTYRLELRKAYRS